jgi:uncharacterized protein
MHGGPGKFAFIILGILILIDIYAFRGLRQLTIGLNPTIRIVATVIYWFIPVFIAFMTFYIIQNMGSITGGKQYYRTFYTFMGVLVLFYVPKLIFSGFEIGNDLTSGILFILKKFNLAQNISSIPVFRYSGAAVASLLFFFTFYGIIHGRYHYKINDVKLEYPNLPIAFNGFKIVHISDWHIGSYYGRPKKIQEAVDRINDLNPDLILFTGDLVNNIASEVEEFIPELKQLKARYGVYSILGNHDYGEYVRWENKHAAEKNLDKLKEIQAEIGFNLLNNQSTVLNIGEDTIRLIGVENWGLPPFPQHGDLKTAINGTAETEFKILMSHDPSHWDEEILKMTDIDLTLSGHTHGMQFGINFKNFKWSPVKLKYPRWAGLYSNGTQKLFVSVGIGYIGFPGRVGIRPEIALIELLKKK